MYFTLKIMIYVFFNHYFHSKRIRSNIHLSYLEINYPQPEIIMFSSITQQSKRKSMKKKEKEKREQS